ncbi:SDR family oxidoreductase [Flavobacterium defluvii]|uniref:Nucleoside-diphosphate-sugar epimerase n=1 Tax=Flavobacterium defluvii TaxID=370979 RepID=A0A1M5NB02_9FLAO|nr:aldehyde reductase [Flavobacterium defluvii]SHG86668.1 Nucleoside-diphosphate-sugar epimerase [Flavobacterium defluvii]
MIHSNQKVLVTGGTGFVAIHSILQLLNRGYQVRTTVRSLKSKDKIYEMLQNGGITDFSTLEFIETDLTSDNNWPEAMTDCQYVLHIASPIFLRLPKDEDEMIRPAVDGTLRVLKAARDAGVKRVVMTSNFGAVGYSHKDKNSLITEESWTDPNEKGLSTYNKSKVLAEKAAWNFMKNEGGSLELSVINPMGIFGPSLNEDLSSGFELLKKLLDGSMKAIPDISLGIVDVRDVAELHILAMEKPEAKGQRFLALSGGTMSLMEIVKFLKEKMPYVTEKAPSKSLPTFIIRLTALFNDQAKAILPLVGINRNASNKKAKTILGWTPRTNEEAITATVISLIKWKSLNI